MISTLLTLALAATAPADPLAPAWSGQIQCYGPDPAAKTCQSIGGYRRAPDGRIFNTASVAINKSPAVVISTEAEVTVKNGAICGVMRPEDIARATFTIEGAPASAAQAEQMTAAMTAAMGPLFTREVCVVGPPPGPAARTETSVDGARVPAMDQLVAWVPADAGYQVRLP